MANYGLDMWNSSGFTIQIQTPGLYLIVAHVHTVGGKSLMTRIRTGSGQLIIGQYSQELTNGLPLCPCVPLSLLCLCCCHHKVFSIVLCQH